MNEEYAAYEAWLAQQDADRYAGYAYGLAEENDRLRTQLAQCCAVVDAATELAKQCRNRIVDEHDDDCDELQVLIAAVAALSGPAPTGEEKP